MTNNQGKCSSVPTVLLDSHRMHYITEHLIDKV